MRKVSKMRGEATIIASLHPCVSLFIVGVCLCIVLIVCMYYCSYNHPSGARYFVHENSDGTLIYSVPGKQVWSVFPKEWMGKGSHEPYVPESPLAQAVTKVQISFKKKNS